MPPTPTAIVRLESGSVGFIVTYIYSLPICKMNAIGFGTVEILHFGWLCDSFDEITNHFFGGSTLHTPRNIDDTPSHHEAIHHCPCTYSIACAGIVGTSHQSWIISTKRRHVAER